MNFREIVLWHVAKYPLLEVQDLVKLSYQSALGSEHMLPPREKVTAYLKEEIAATPQTDGELFTPIGGNLCRMNLAAFEKSGLRSETAAGMFLCAGKAGSRDLEGNLRTIEEMAAKGELPMNAHEVKKFLREYREKGCPAVHHSETFRREYHPAYRIVPASLAARLELFRAMDKILAEKGEIRVAIDGMAASGKSTFAEQLKTVYDANLFHMDDYFLPFERKTPERLSEPGGNVDYERFAEEIKCRKNTDSFAYRPYDCSTGALADEIAVAPNPVFITEGAYSLHPTLRDAYDLKIFFGIDPELQSARILRRNGEKMHARFINEWIPMENIYIDKCGIKNICEITLTAHDEDNFLRKIRIPNTCSN